MSDREAMLECDLVMKGGITSGIVYPAAVAELAKTFRFRNIGGTSAGAIAAAVTAAAAYGRANGNENSFAQVAQLPQELAQPVNASPTRLLGLFQPDRKHRILFRFLMMALSCKQPFQNLKRMLSLFRCFWIEGLLGAGFGLLPFICFWLFWPQNATDSVVRAILIAAIVTLVIAAILAVLSIVIFIYLRAKKNLPKTFFGICSGMPPLAEPTPQKDLSAWIKNLPSRIYDLFHPAPQQAEYLTQWLHELIQSSAGRKPNQPLTMRDLKTAYGSTDPQFPDISLVLNITNISRGVAMQFPQIGDLPQNTLMFKRSEMEQFFPTEIVAHMVAKAPKELPDSDKVDGKSKKLPEGYHRLPLPDDLPILLGARLSLSFPVLLSAIPLYELNFNDKSDPQFHALNPVWFSDGGITSNFPIHFFDSAQPPPPPIAHKIKKNPKNKRKPKRKKKKTPPRHQKVFIKKKKKNETK